MSSDKVRLTEQAHQILSREAEDQGISMKERASKAIISPSKSKREKHECNQYLFTIDSLDRKIQDTERYARDTERYARRLFILGVSIGVFLALVVWFFIGV